MTIVLITSCSQDHFHDLEAKTIKTDDYHDETELRSSYNFSTLSYPSVVNNTLEFSSPDAFLQFYKTANDYYEVDNYMFDSLIASIYVDSSEVNPLPLQNFNSIYKNVVFQEFSSIQEFNKPATGDPVMWALVNEYYEFIAGDWLYVILSDELIARLPKNSSSKSVVRLAVKGQNMSDYMSLPSDVLIGSDTDLGLFPGSYDPRPDPDTVILRGLCNADVNVKYIDCNTIEVYGFASNLFGGAGTADFDICITSYPLSEYEMRQLLNNNTCINTLNISASTVSGKFSFITDITPGQFYINVLADSRCSGHDGFISFNADLNTCDFGEKTTWSPVYAESGPLTYGTQGVHGYVYYNETWIQSYTGTKAYGKWWDGNDWKPHRKNLIVEIDEWRNNNSCNKTGINKVDVDECRRCYSERVRVNGGWNPNNGANGHCDIDTEGTFTKRNGNVIVSGSIFNDYDCCQ